MAVLASTAADRRRHYRIIDAARELYPVPYHPATVTRHILRGVRLRDGSTKKLAAVRAPGGWLVTREAVEDFLAAITADRCGESMPAFRGDHRVDAALDAAGF